MRLILALAAAETVVLGGCASHVPPARPTMMAPEPLLNAPAASPAGAPAAPVAVPPSQRVVRYTEGRYELHGDGTSASPYYWVWIPTGATPPAPPPSPSR